jgi:RNA polymerase sigma-70 factor (ECF subfamily)
MAPSSMSEGAGPGPLDATIERTLIDRARDGDGSAFDRLVDAHLPRVWRVVWPIVRDDADADDVVQEVFLSAWRSLGRFRGDARFGTWLHRIAVTRALNHLDRSGERARRSAVPLEPADESGSGAPPADGVAATPLETLEARELAKRLAQCWERLPPDWRAVLALRQQEDLPYERIAEVLAVAIGTVRSRLARARAALRACIEEALA